MKIDTLSLSQKLKINTKLKGWVEFQQRLNWNDFLWIGFLLLIPTQLGKHWWPEWSLAGGVRSDYLSPILYLIDLVWLGVVIINWRKGKEIVKEVKWWRIGTIMLLIAGNLAVAENKGAAIYHWLRIGQWGITLMMAVKEKVKIKVLLKLLVPIWIAGETFLGLAQVINGSSLQGIFYWLGERRFNLGTPGIALMAINGREMLRAYGTFSHPNSMAGFLLVAWGWWNFEVKIKNRVEWWAIWWIGLLGIFITGSRTVWVLAIILMIIALRKNKLIWVGTLLGICLSGYYILKNLSGWDMSGLQKRWQLMVAAIEMVRKSPLLGVGAGNFVNNLPELTKMTKVYWWQPVHNIIILPLSEIGILGIVWVFWWIKKYLEKISWKRCWWLGVVLVGTGMVDHYWLTLPQNTWLLAVMIGILG